MPAKGSSVSDANITVNRLHLSAWDRCMCTLDFFSSPPFSTSLAEFQRVTPLTRFDRKIGNRMQFLEQQEYLLETISQFTVRLNYFVTG